MANNNNIPFELKNVIVSFTNPFDIVNIRLLNKEWKITVDSVLKIKQNVYNILNRINDAEELFNVTTINNFWKKSVIDFLNTTVFYNYNHYYEYSNVVYFVKKYLKNTLLSLNASKFYRQWFPEITGIPYNLNKAHVSYIYYVITHLTDTDNILFYLTMVDEADVYSEIKVMMRYGHLDMLIQFLEWRYIILQKERVPLEFAILYATTKTEIDRITSVYHIAHEIPISMFSKILNKLDYDLAVYFIDKISSHLSADYLLYLIDNECINNREIYKKLLFMTY